MAAGQLDLRQGGLRSALPQRRWDSSLLVEPEAAARRARQSESDIAASQNHVVTEEVPEQPKGDAPRTRWAGPGSGYPRPTRGPYDVKQSFQTQTLPSASTSRPRVNVVWHKMSDLRLHDHEPVSRAHLEQPRLPVVHMHVFDPFWFGYTRLGRFRKTGSVRGRFWLECVEDLRNSLETRGQHLFLRFGMSAAAALQQLTAQVQIATVFTFAEVCSEELQQEAEFEEALRQLGGSAKLVRCWGYTLHHIDDLAQGCGKPPERWINPSLSFGSFKREIRSCRVRPVAAEWQHLPKSGGLSRPPDVDEAWWGDVPSLAALGYSREELCEAEEARSLSAIPWRGGESLALARLQAYIWERRALKQYVGTTDWTANGKCTAPNDQTSKLSPYLAFGCLSPRLLYWEIQRFEKGDRCKGAKGLINSLLWRDFYRFIVHYAWGNRMYHLYGPMNCGSVPGGHKTPTKWCCKHYNNLFGGSDPRLWTWEKNLEKFGKWASGTTGFPFVDAAMLELKQTGYMLHLNRETVGWFFVRDLQTDWRLAAEWFESRLLDYDCVLNWGNWAYFILTQLPAREDDRPGGGPRYTLPRYSPYLMATQVLGWGRDHDPSAGYVKKWIRSLGSLPAELAREPWKLQAGDLDLEPLSDDFWSCATCTLHNPPTNRRCEACNSRRPACSSANTTALGIYAEQPMVPPPPEDSMGLCANCGSVDAGWASEEAVFYCETCWAQWATDTVTLGGDALRARPLSELGESQISDGWALVPDAALLGPVGGEGGTAGELAKPPPVAKKGGRWGVRDRTDKVAGG